MEEVEVIIYTSEEAATLKPTVAVLFRKAILILLQVPHFKECLQLKSHYHYVVAYEFLRAAAIATVQQCHRYLSMPILVCNVSSRPTSGQ